jgi:hypothetical protein
MEAWRIGGGESKGKDDRIVRLPLVGIEGNSFGRQKNLSKKAAGHGDHTASRWSAIGSTGEESVKKNS